MAMIFGADSGFAADTRLGNGYTLHDWVMRRNCFPAFWGRSLTGDTPISAEEIEFLHGKNCKIALVLRDLTEEGVSTNDGTADALRAVEAAKALHVPEGVALFAEIRDDWSVNHNWMIGFAQVLRDNGYIPGFIGNTDSSKNFNFDRQCGHYALATQEQGEYGAVYWATEPKTGGEPSDWAPFCPSDLTPERIGLWRVGSVGVGGVSAGTDYAREAALLDCMW